MRLRSASKPNRLEQVLSAQRPRSEQPSDPAPPTVADPRTEVQDLEARVAALERWIERLKNMFYAFDDRVAKLEPTE